MADYTGPIPTPTPETRPFWEAARRHELSLQRCRSCGRHIFYPRAACPHCFSADLEWRLIEAGDPLWHVRAARAASRECDVLLSTNSYLTAWFTRVPTVVVAHDAIAWKPEMRPQRRAGRIERATAGRYLGSP